MAYVVRGDQDITEEDFYKRYRKKLDRICMKPNIRFIVGGSGYLDLLVQHVLCFYDVKDVLVCYVAGEPLRNLGGWRTKEFLGKDDILEFIENNEYGVRYVYPHFHKVMIRPLIV